MDTLLSIFFTSSSPSFLGAAATATTAATTAAGGGGASGAGGASSSSVWSALLAGYVATLCFTVQYIPQTMLNHRRKSVSGFSTVGILIKLIGSCFLCVNSFLMGEELPVVLYGCLSILQHCVFVVQFALYSNRDRDNSNILVLTTPSSPTSANNTNASSKRGNAANNGFSSYLLWLFFPLVPYVMGICLPWTVAFTSGVKPLTQVLSHLPQLFVTYTKQTTDGVSLFTQHLNIVGGLAGLYMYSIIPPKSSMTYAMYIFSLLQAVSMYAFAVHFDGFERIISSLSFSSSAQDSTATKQQLNQDAPRASQSHKSSSPSAEAVMASSPVVATSVVTHRASG